MSTRSVVIWLLIAVAMGVAAVVLLRGGTLGGAAPAKSASVAAIPAGERILAFSPGDVTRIVIEGGDPGTPRQILDRPSATTSTLSTDAEWRLLIEPGLPGAFAPPPWPLESAQMQPLLRVLSETRSIAAPSPDASLGLRPIAVRMTIRGSIVTLKLAERTIAGSGLIEIESIDSALSTTPAIRRAVVDDKLHAVFTQPGPRAWRVRTPAAAIAPEASRITLDNTKQKLVLAKIDGRWVMREPAAAPADPGSVQRLIAQLTRISVADFLDTGPSGSTGLERPVARLTIEVDRRTLPKDSPEPVITTESFAMTIGGPADASNARLFASINDERTVLLDSRSLQPLSTDAAQYVWPHPTRSAPADIGRIEITSIGVPPLPPGPSDRTLRRGSIRWVQILPDNTELALVDKDKSDADALVTFLTGGDRSAFAPGGQTPAAPLPENAAPTIELAAPLSGRPIGTITMRSLSGDTLETIDILALQTGVFTLRTGPIWRTYSVAQVPNLLRDFVSSARIADQPAAAPPAGK
ncbi:MAG: DUF4340 domain-containing protein [Phycisphaerales bacterium]|nr:DUF4340 domain-containing protein [Phycisphaerales bacterium]